MTEVNQFQFPGEGTTDFVVETEGHCFLCLKGIFLESESESATLSSLQYLFNYLRLDLSKLVSTEMNVLKLERSKLKGSLCEGCASMNDRFSELCGQLERIRMEVEHCLGGIHGKLTEAGDGWQRLKVRSSSADLNPALRIAEELRGQALKKCYHKLHRSQPRVLLKKLKMDTSRACFRADADEDLSSAPSLEVSVCSSAPVKMEEPEVDQNSDGYRHEDITSAPEDEGDFDDDVKQEEDEEVTVTVTEPVPIKLQITAKPRRPRGMMSKNFSFNKSTGKWQCKLCQEKFYSRSSWYVHYKGIHQKLRYKCSICDKEFTQSSGLGLHNRRFHSGVPAHQRESERACPAGEDKVEEEEFNELASENRTARPQRHCKVPAPSVETETEAERISDEPEPHRMHSTHSLNFSFNKATRKSQCTLCPQKFNSKSNWYMHYKYVHKKLRNKCSICDKEFTQSGHLQRHLKNVHMRRRFRCRTCGKISSFRRNIVVHQEQSKGVCPVGKDEIEEVQLSTENRTEWLQRQCKVSVPLLETEPKPKLKTPVGKKYQCKICQKGFNSRDGWSRHHKTVHQEVRHKCPICNKLLTTTNGLTRHLQKIHSTTRFRCRTCSNVYTRRHLVLAHQLQSEGACPEGHDEIEVLTAEKVMLAEEEEEHPQIKVEKSETPTVDDPPIGPLEASPAVGDVVSAEAEEPEGIDLDLEMLGKPRHMLSRNVGFNPATGKHQCKVCRKDFNSRSNWYMHYRSVHQKLRYECPTCGKVFSQACTFGLHRRRVHLGMRYRCRTCGEISYRRKDLVVHQLESKGACRSGKEEVEEVSLPAENLTRRRKRKDEVSVPTKSKSRNRKKKKTSSPSSVLMCQDCGKQFTTEKGLQSHRASVESGMSCTAADADTHQCGTCQKCFNSKTYLSQHHENVHLKLRHKCPNCDKEFSQSSTLRRHQKDVHFRTRYRCRTCKKDFSRRDYALAHQRQSEGACPEGKDEIEVVTVTKEESDEEVSQTEDDKGDSSHLETAGEVGDEVAVEPEHPTQDTKKYQCEVCGKEFNNMKYLNKHHRNVHQQLSYKCPICQKEVTQSCSLRKHYLNVHLKRRFRCRTCGLISSVRRNIVIHQWKSQGACPGGGDEVEVVRRTSSGAYVVDSALAARSKVTVPGRKAKPNSKGTPEQQVDDLPPPVWTCQDCGREFVTAGGLQTHRESANSSGKPCNEIPVQKRIVISVQHQCELCGKEFNSRNSWHNHYKYVHQKLRYKCPICNKEFTQPSTLRKHHKNFHLGRSYRCRTCGKVSNERKDIVDHQRQSGGSCRKGKKEVEILKGTGIGTGEGEVNQPITVGNDGPELDREEM